jgi:hypothetical protein
LEFVVPVKRTTPIPLFNTEDEGNYVLQILERPNEYDEKIVYMASDFLTMPQIASIYSKVVGRPSRFISISPDEWASKGGNKELVEMYKYIDEYGLFGRQQVEESKKISPSLTSFEEWLGRGTLIPSTIVSR